MAATVTTTPRQKFGWGTANFVVIALALIPVLWMVSLSFKTPAAIARPDLHPGAVDLGELQPGSCTARSSSGRWSTRSASA